MSRFSEQLCFFMKEKKATPATIASAGKLERTNVYKLSKGKYLPQDTSTVEDLAAALTLSPGQMTELMESYKISKIGETTYCKLKYTKKFISDFYKLFLDTGKPVVKMHYDIASLPQTISGSVNINSLLKILIDAEASLDNGKIKIIAQPEYEFLFDCLLTTNIHSSNLTITHILRLNNLDLSTEIGYQYNLLCFKSIASLLMLKCNYTPFFYYDSITNQCNDTNLFPYIIITSLCVICVANDFNHAIILNNAEYINTYNSIYKNLESKCNSIITKLNSPIDHLSHYLSQDDSLKKTDATYSLTLQPCFTCFLHTNDILETYLAPGLPHRDMIIKMLKTHVENAKNFSESKHIYTYFTKRGLEDFLSTGKMLECPSEYCLPFSETDRYVLLEEAYKASQNGFYHPSLINTDKFNISDNLIIASYVNTLVSFLYYHSIKGYMIFSLNEVTLANSIYEFLSLLKFSDLVLSEEETIAYIKDKIDSYNNNNSISTK